MPSTRSMPDLDDLLAKTSRTFALSIPLLPEPTRREVGVAYLLFRIADNFEDATTWSRDQRSAALQIFSELLEQPSCEEAESWAAQWVAAVPIDHQGYQELLTEVPAVLDAYFELGREARRLVGEHTVRTAVGMAEFVHRTDDAGRLRLRDLEDLCAYCYVVAGIVGEMLTELFLLGRAELMPVADTLRSRSRAFGEGLQLVNILKDSAFDATEGRSYLPVGVALADVFARARQDLDLAVEYVTALQTAGTEKGLVAFNALNMLLAFASLDKIESDGPGAKIGRPRVHAIYEDLQRALANGESITSLL